ncbi:GH3 family domain-containing protein [Rubinisphaera margarita]|uniref:GH3 family domain-containing protein n=1 Tax=Rubinisphaera margarita TaxID=2909586 RepID=UPI001EE88653|nr:GH3 auxin-responsive promoter family protein [Rubinisphaera margarita]MCG6158235.1 GH3 auxin-responsive promoter family protein [Rubinisphaera margarita]
MNSSRVDRPLQASDGIAPWLVYPVTMTLCLGLFFAFEQMGWPTFWASFVPALLGAGLVQLAERKMPARIEWIPDRQTVSADVAYMILVQILLPQGLALIAALALQRWLTAQQWTAGLWVHHWPILVQVVLMILLADFLRYWLHVACHRIPFLWRFHAVHHSPHRLYWLNVGRFHPLEKSTQFLFDAFPFILLGVSDRVLALYFVFYAVNGFFQHCNIHLRFGWLNYVISSAELHRWHHSHVPKEANANYGNNVIVWDVLFGTRFLPKDRLVAKLGLKNREYPSRFWTQMRTPFVPGLDQKSTETFSSARPDLLLRLRMAWIERRNWKPIQRKTDDPEEAQRNVLRAIMNSHRETEFGRIHQFDRVDSLDDFRRNVPFNDYDSLLPYIDTQERTGQPALNPDRPELYNVTSGTTGAAKYIPIRSQTLQDLRRTQQLFALFQHRADERAFAGRIIAIAGAGIEGHRSSGIPFGSASGVLYASMPRLIRNRYVLPPEVFEIDNYELKYYVILRLALAERDVTYLGTANPSTILRLLDLLEEHRDRLLEDIERGVVSAANGDLLRLDRAIIARCRPDPERAETLRRIMDENPPQLLTRIWPRLAMLSTWTGGSCGIALGAVRKRLDPQVSVMGLGLMASELTVTVPMNADEESGLPTFWSNVFEFVERETFDQGNQSCLGLHELELGEQYYLFVTTPSGLFRYAMNDIIEVTGFYGRTPLLRFVQKGAGITNITGEKLHECQLIESVHRLESDCRAEASFFLAVADEETARYRLFIEWQTPPADGSSEKQYADVLDRLLGEANLEYAAKRDSGRLKPVVVVSLQPGSGERFKQFELSRGRREAQFKTVALLYARELNFDFAACSYSEV